MSRIRLDPQSGPRYWVLLDDPERCFTIDGYIDASNWMLTMKVQSLEWVARDAVIFNCVIVDPAGSDDGVNHDTDAFRIVVADNWVHESVWTDYMLLRLTKALLHPVLKPMSWYKRQGNMDV